MPHARNTTLARSGRTATGDRQYVCRVLGADVPPLGEVLVAQSVRTAIGDCRYVPRML